MNPRLIVSGLVVAACLATGAQAQVTVDVAKSDAARAGGVAASFTVLWIVIGARRRAARKAGAEPPVG